MSALVWPINLRPVLIVLLVLLSLSLSACEPDHYDEPKPGVPDQRLLGLSASYNLSVRGNSRFLGGFSDFEQLEFKTALQEIAAKHPLQYLDSAQQALLQQRYQAELRQLAPRHWPAEPRFIAATVIDQPANYLILLVEVPRPGKASTLAMLRAQTILEFFSPAIMVSGLLEDKSDRAATQTEKHGNYQIAQLNVEAMRHLNYRYHLYLDQLCSAAHPERLGLAAIKLVAEKFDAKENQVLEDTQYTLDDVKTSDLACWQQDPLKSDSKLQAVARRAAFLRLTYLKQDGALLELRLTQQQRAYPANTDEQSKVLLIWCAKYLQCQTAYASAAYSSRRDGFSTPLNSNFGLFLASDNQAGLHLQELDFNQSGSAEQPCYLSQLRRDLQLNASGIQASQTKSILPELQIMAAERDFEFKPVRRIPAMVLHGSSYPNRCSSPPVSAVVR